MFGATSPLSLDLDLWNRSQGGLDDGAAEDPAILAGVYEGWGKAFNVYFEGDETCRFFWGGSNSIQPRGSLDTPSAWTLAVDWRPVLGLFLAKTSWDRLQIAHNPNENHRCTKRMVGWQCLLCNPAGRDRFVHQTHWLRKHLLPEDVQVLATDTFVWIKSLE